MCLIGLSSFLLGLLSVIGFYFWIKNIIIITIIYSIGLSFILYSVFMIIVILKISLKDEYIYSTIIFNFSILYAIAFSLTKIISDLYQYIINFKSLYTENILFLVKIYFIDIIQFILIIFFVYLGFFLELNKYFISNTKFMIWTFVVVSFILLLLSLILCLIKYNHRETNGNGWNIYHFIFVPSIIIYSFLLSKFVEQKIILCLLFIFLSDLIALELYTLYSKSDNFCGYFFIPFIINAIAVILFHFLWIKSNIAIIYIPIIAFAYVIYLNIFIFLFIKAICDKDEIKIASIFITYGIFCFIVHIIWGLLAIPALIIYGICICLSSICKE